MFTTDKLKYYSFSLIELLSLLQDTTIEKVTIRTYAIKKGGSSWLSDLWNTSSLLMIETYKKKGFNIRFEKKGRTDYIYISKD